MSTMPAVAPAQEVAERLVEDGHVLVTGLLDAAGVHAAKTDLARVLAATRTGRNFFEGFSTQRVYALFAKAEVAR